MPKLIVDQFTSRPVSRQRKYQLRKQAKGQCRICGKLAKDGICPKHAAQSRDIMRLHRLGSDPIMDLI